MFCLSTGRDFVKVRNDVLLNLKSTGLKARRMAGGDAGTADITKKILEINKKNILNCLINSTGNVLLGGEAVEVRNLAKTVRQKLVENDKLIISVKAHSASNYMDYVKVIDQLKQANATRISIAESD